MDEHLRTTRPTWVWAGGFLIASALFPLVVQQSGGVVSSVIGWLSAAMFAASMILFAVGRDSVVARRPLGTVALFALGLWPIAGNLVFALASASAGGSLESPPPWFAAWGYVAMIVPIAAAIVAAIAVARAGVVADRLRWIPLVAVALVVLPGVVIQIVGVAAPGIILGSGAPLLFAFGSLANLVALVGLGVVAVVAGLTARRPAASIQVFPSD